MIFKKNVRFSKSIRLVLYEYLFLFCILILISRLFYLTIIKGAYFKDISENNRIKEKIIEAKRGTIFDRKGIIVAKSKPVPNKQKNKYQRLYPFNEALAHVVGYLQIPSKQDIKNDICENPLYHLSPVGKTGAEKLFECKLRGKNGKKLFEIDAKGREIKTISVITPKNGSDITLSIDAEIQQYAYKSIQENLFLTNKKINYAEKKIAIIASNPKTGEILLMLSYPSFNPEYFHTYPQKTLAYLYDKNKPLVNRTLQGVYPPGSTFKIAVALGALEEKAIDEQFSIEDTGSIKAGPLTFSNWYWLKYGKTDGKVSVVKALQRSNDIFFYKIGSLLGPEKIKKWAMRLGAGKISNIGLTEEEGLIPSPFWKKEVLKEKWFLGDTYNMSIGQGYILATPMQINRMTSVIANEGFLCQPTLIKKNSAGVNCKRLVNNSKNIKIIKKGMLQACMTGGTAWPFFNFAVKTATDSSMLKEIRVGCKTGTAESHAKSGLPHAWFTVFAPFENPEIVLTVLVEESGEGSDIAAPIAKSILTYYFERKE